MYKLGIDLGGTNIAVGVVDSEHKIIAKTSVPTNLPDTADNIVSRIYDASVKCLEKAGIKKEELDAVGVGTPGAVDSENGIVLFANNLKFDNVPLGPKLTEKFGKKVYCENDANAAAFGEYLVTEGESSDTLVAITIGTGIGGGVIIDGKLYSGNKFSGGELGHMVINFDGIPCSCGRKGCYEVYASASALVRQTKEAMQNNPESKLWQVCGDIEKVTGKTAFDGLRLGDKVAIDVVEQYADYVSIGLVDIINTFGPATICLAGGVSKEGETLLEPIRRHIEMNKPVNCHTTVCIAKLDNDAGIIGAANLDISNTRNGW